MGLTFSLGYDSHPNSMARGHRWYGPGEVGVGPARSLPPGGPIMDQNRGNEGLCWENLGENHGFSP